MSRKVIRWGELGRPTEPGTYTVRGVGRVIVTRADINEAAQMKTPEVALTEELSFDANMKQYAIMYFQEGGGK